MTKLTTQAVADLAKELFRSRQTRKTIPEGKFDPVTGFWYPTDREDQGATKEVEPPSAAWPHSFLIHCRSKRHCTTLIERALAGKDVSPDAMEVVTRPQGKSYNLDRIPDDDAIRRLVKQYVAEELLRARST